MKNLYWALCLTVVLSMASSSSTSQKHRVMTGTAAKGAASAGMGVASDIDQRLAKWRVVRMPFRSKDLTQNEIKMVEKLVDACRNLESIYWRQSDPEGLAAYQALEHSTSPRDMKVRRLLMINGSRFDLFTAFEHYLRRISVNSCNC